MSSGAKGTNWGRTFLLVAMLPVVGAIAVAVALNRPEMIPVLLATLCGAVAGFILIMYSALFTAIAVHEAGHLAAGTLAGFQFRFVQAMNIGLSRVGGRLRLYTIRNPFIGGMAGMTPPEAPELARPMRLFIAGGPIASLVYATAAFAVWRAVQTPGRQPLPYMVLEFVAFAFMASAVLLLPGSLLPLIVQGVASDARLLLLLREKSTNRDRMLALFLLPRELHAGVRPRDWPDQLVRQLLEPIDGSDMEARARIFAYYWAIDSGLRDAAREHLARAHLLASERRKKLGILADVIFYEWSWFQATVEGDGKAAREAFDNVRSNFTMLEATRLKAETALALAGGRFEEARDLAQKGLRALERSEQRTGYKAPMDEEWLLSIVSRADLTEGPPRVG